MIFPSNIDHRKQFLQKYKKEITIFLGGGAEIQRAQKTPLITNFGAPLLFYTLDYGISWPKREKYPKIFVLTSLA